MTRKSGSSSRSLFVALLAQMPRDVLVHVLEHAFARLHALFGEHADGFGFAAGGAYELDRGFLRGRVLSVVPFAESDKVGLEAFHRIAERPAFGFVGRAIARGI